MYFVSGAVMKFFGFLMADYNINNKKGNFNLMYMNSDILALIYTFIDSKTRQVECA